MSPFPLLNPPIHPKAQPLPQSPPLPSQAASDLRIAPLIAPSLQGSVRVRQRRRRYDAAMSDNHEPPTASILFDDDSPLSDPRDDKFDRAAFASGIAQSIAALPHGKCFAIGLDGPWGDGKTTVLQFVAAELAKSKQKYKVGWIHPWKFVDEH